MHAEILTLSELDILNSIAIELHKAETKHPAWTKDVIHATSIMQEESGEAIRAAIQYVYENGNIVELKKELIQTAAMCIRVLKNLK